MTQQAQQPQGKTSHFDAAKIIVETLQGLDKTSQVLAMRFAAETLGLQSATTIEAPEVTVTPVSTPASPQGGGGATHSTDIKQFAAAKAPRTDQQFAAVAAYFYRFEAPQAQRKETIDAASLLEATRLAGRKRPGNPGLTLNNAKNSGYLDVASPGKFRINSVGENLVAMTLPGNASEGLPAQSAPKNKSAKKKTSKKTKSSKK